MKNKVLKIITLLLLVTGIALSVLYREQLNVEQIDRWISDAGAAGPVIFMLVYIVGTVLFFPGSVLTLVGGALFGPVLGTFYNLTGATIGAIISFMIARYLAQDWVEEKAGGRMGALKQGVENEGWRFVAFVRLVPLFPFNLLNYALGITRIKLSHYSLATYICMLPGAIAYTYIGYVGHEALAGDESVIKKVLIGIALLAIAGFVPGMISRMRKVNFVTVEVLQKVLNEQTNELLLDVRNPDEYDGEMGHIAGSLLIPLAELKSNIESIQHFENSPVYVVCRTDVRSAKAARLLEQNGFSNVSVVKGGMQQWNQVSLPVE